MNRQTHKQTDTTNSIFTAEIWKSESLLGEVTILEIEGNEF
jgi:hypothetical protein